MHIRELNAAWDVLGDPVERAAYDQRLGAGAPAAGQPRPAGPAGSTASGRPPVVPRARSFDDRLVDPRTAGDWDGGRRGWRWVPVAALLVVAALVVTVTAYASHGHESPSGTTGGVQVPSGFPVGSCVAVVAGPQAFEVPCDQPHTGTVAATTDYPRPCPPDTFTVALVADEISLCLRSS